LRQSEIFFGKNSYSARARRSSSQFEMFADFRDISRYPHQRAGKLEVAHYPKQKNPRPSKRGFGEKRSARRGTTKTRVWVNRLFG